MTAVCDKSDDEILELLLSHGAPFPLPLIRQACAAGLARSLRVILARSSTFDESKDCDCNLLHIAASNQHVAVVKVLLEHGTNVNAGNRIFGSPLIAGLEGYLAPYLSGSDNLRHHSGWQRLEISKELRKDKSYESLIAALPRPVPVHENRYQHHVIPQSRIPPEICNQIVQSLLQHGANANTGLRGLGSALHLASIAGLGAVVRLLLDHGADVNLDGGYFGTPLQAAQAFHHEQIIELLLERGARLSDTKRDSPILPQSSPVDEKQWPSPRREFETWTQRHRMSRGRH